MRFYSVLLIFGLCCCPALLEAKTINHQQAQVQIWLPDSWNDTQSGNALTISDPQQEVALIFSIMEHGDIQSALQALKGIMVLSFGNLSKSGAVTQRTINGMQAALQDYTGMYQGRSVGISVMLLKTPGGKILLCFGIVDNSKLLKHAARLLKIITHIKPISTGWSTGQHKRTDPALSAAEWITLYDRLSKSANDSQRLGVLKGATRNRRITAGHLSFAVNTFTSDAGKLEAIRSCAGKVSDPEYAGSIPFMISDSAMQAEAARLINQ